MNFPAPRIEPAAVEHLPEIAKLASVIWFTCYSGIITREQIAYMLSRMYAEEVLRDEMLSKGIRYERLLLGDECVGFASFGPTAAPGKFKLHKLYLHPDWHGKGLGSLLLRHCFEEVRRCGGRKLVLNVNKLNRTAIAVYERNGFFNCGTQVTDIGGGFVMDDFVMERKLDS